MMGPNVLLAYSIMGVKTGDVDWHKGFCITETYSLTQSMFKQIVL